MDSQTHTAKHAQNIPYCEQVGNVECVGEDRIRFDFLGKDSMRYENEVAVHPTVFSLMQAFCKGERPAIK